MAPLVPNLSTTIDGGYWSASLPGSFTPEGKATGSRWIGCWLVPRVVLETVEQTRVFVTARPVARP